MTRTLDQVDPETLALLAPVACATAVHESILGTPCSMMRPEAVVRALATAAGLDTRVAGCLQLLLDSVLGTPMKDASIAELATCLRCARWRGDGLAAAAVLWLAAREEGLAWRRFEAQARGELLHIALRALARAPAHASRRTDMHSSNSTQPSCQLDSDASGAILLRVDGVALRLGEAEAEALYEALGDALARTVLARLLGPGLTDESPNPRALAAK